MWKHVYMYALVYICMYTCVYDSVFLTQTLILNASPEPWSPVPFLWRLPQTSYCEADPARTKCDVSIIHMHACTAHINIVWCTVCVRIHVDMHVCIYVCTCIYACMHICVFACMCMYTYVVLQTCIYVSTGLHVSALLMCT